ncbi:MAG: tetratricopeptide repeat protein [Alphaproteobacteria bacterium]
MRSLVVCSAMTLMLVPHAFAADNALKRCQAGLATVQGIAACTEAINSGKLTTADRVTALTSRGYYYNGSQEWDKAAADFSRAVSANISGFDTAMAYYGLGQLAAQKGDNAHALADFEAAVRVEPILVEPYFDAGRIRLIQNEYDKAIGDFSNFIATKKDNPLAYAGRAAAYSAEHHYGLAISDYDEALSLRPGASLTRVLRGNAYFNMKDYDHALADYSEAIRLDPKLPEAYFRRGLMYFSENTYTSAIADFGQAIALAPNNPDAYYMRGKAYFYEGEAPALGIMADVLKGKDIDTNDDRKADKSLCSRAIADFTQAIRLKPDFAHAYYDRGFARRCIGDETGHDSDVAAAGKLDPHLAE